MRKYLSHIGLALLLCVAFLRAEPPLAPVPTGKPSTYPGWWFSRGVIGELNPNNPAVYPGNYPAADDFTAANAGQLKAFASAAYDEINANPPGGGGATLQQLIAAWYVTDDSGNFVLDENGNRIPRVTAQTDDFAAINVGQLKNVVQTFYTRLQAIHYPGTLTLSGTADDWAMVNVGQMKNVFSFDVAGNMDTNGLPLWWETYYFGGGVNSGNAAQGVAGLTIMDSWLRGMNPTNYYDGHMPTLAKVGGDNQSGKASTFLPQALVVRVSDAATGLALAGAPVTVSVAPAGLIASSPSGTTSSTYTTRADSAGMVAIYFQYPSSPTGIYQVTVQAFQSSAPAVVFSETVAPALTFTAGGGTLAPASVALSANATSTTSISIYEGQQLLGTQSGSSYTLNLSNVGAGVHIYTAIARNASGATAQATATQTVNIPENPVASNWYTRGTGTDQAYLSSLIALDFERGFKINDMGTTQFNGQTLPWFMHLVDQEQTLYHIVKGSSTPVFTLPFQNPVVAFGQSSGGSPLYTNQPYRFGLAAGGQQGLQQAGITEIEVDVYLKSFAVTDGNGGILPWAAMTVLLPVAGTSQWDTFAQNGYVADIHTQPGATVATTRGIPATNVVYSNPSFLNIDFDTQIQLVPGGQLTDGWNEPTNWPVILTHTSANSDFQFVVKYRGATIDASGNGWGMATANASNPNSAVATNFSYALDFTDRPAWSSTALSQPNFNGQVIPSQYAGMSPEELLHVSSPVTFQFSAPDSTYAALDDSMTPVISPELRTHPILDKFVRDMNYDPVALTNYVLNNIQLTDAVSYNDSVASTAPAQLTDASIQQGGVNRGALATFLEKQGNPAEQCALLIYFLRRCNIPCGYVFPPHDSVQVLDLRMSNILHMQLHGAQTPAGNNTSVPQLLNVNYPWVAVYTGNQWSHVFPWLKDTSIQEGYNLTDFLPSAPQAGDYLQEGYKTGLQWLEHYIYRDNSVLPPGKTWATVETDNPGYLYPLWVDRQLAAFGLSRDDVGVRFYDRQNNFQTTSQFPQPWSVNTSGFSTSITASSRNIYSSLSQTPLTTNDSTGIPAIFDTVQVIAYSDRNNNQTYVTGEPIVQTPVIPALYLHNRRLMVQEVQTSSGANTYNFQLSLEPSIFIAGSTTTPGTFTGDLKLGQQVQSSVNLTSALVSGKPTDDALRFRLIYNRHRKLPASFYSANSPTNPLGPNTGPNSVPDQWNTFMGVTDDEQIVNERPFRVGDVITLCLNFGCVSQEMLDAQAQNFWTAQQYDLINNKTMDQSMAVGGPLYLMGMSYYKQVSDFRKTVEALEKQTTVSFFASGLSKMSPQRTSTGTLANNGAVNLLYPNVDMYFQRMAYAFNGTLRPDAGMPPGIVDNDWFNILIGEVSAQEHTIINKFFNLQNTASTVNLLHAAVVQNGVGSLLNLNDNPNDSNYYLNYSNTPPAGHSKIFYSGKAADGVTAASKTLQDWDPGAWKVISDTLTPYNGTTGNYDADFSTVLVTPGPIIIAGNKTYEGVGALVLDPGVLASALISGNGLNVPTNGGYADSIFTDYGSSFNSMSFNTPSLSDNSALYINSSGSYSLNLGTPQVYTLANTSITVPTIYTGNSATFDISRNITNLSNSTSILDYSAVTSASQSYTTIAGFTLNSGNTAAAVTAIANTSSAGPQNYVGQAWAQVAEPVDSVTGAFYSSDTDMVVPGPMPIAVNRNYSSLNQAANEFGYGWKLNYFPSLILGSGNNSNLIYAAEMDGSVIAYRQVAGSNPVTWTPLAADNPQLVNQTGLAPGSSFNPFNNKITRSGTEPNATYTLTGAGGSVRTFVDKSFPLPFKPGTPTSQQVTRQRPYLTKWEDPQHNYLTFTFGGDDATTRNGYGIVGGSAVLDYGFLNRIASSNGNYVQFDYDTNGHIVSVNSGDGRRLTYSYDGYGDLIGVTLPDASTVSYTYSHQSTAFASGITSGSTTVTVASTAALYAGETVSGTGIPASDTIASITNGTSFVLTSPATATNASAGLTYGSGFYSEHLITQVTKPEGRLLVNVYEPTDGTHPASTTRRVQIQKATVGTNNALVANATFAYRFANGTTRPADLSTSPITGYTTVIDANTPPQTTRYDYTNSQITTITDPLGQTMQQTWYATTGNGGYQQSLATHTDKRGLKQTYTYDANGNVTQIDTTGNLTGAGGSQTASRTFTNYTAQNLPGKITDVTTGNYQVFTFGSSISAYLPTKVQSFAADNTLVSEMDNTYGTAGTIGTPPFAAGVLTQASQGLPGTTDLSTVNRTYDTGGFPNSESRVTGTNDPAVTVSLTHNLRGELTQSTDAAGRYTTFTYDGLGHPTGVENYDQNNNLVGWNYKYYNSNGDLEWTQGARFNPVDYTMNVYDGGGRLSQHLVWLSEVNAGKTGVQAASANDGVATTTYTHDALGNLTQIMDPLGNTVTMGYDFGGQMTSRTWNTPFDSGDGLQPAESWNISHDGGKTVIHINSLGGQTTSKYTDTGKMSEQDNPDGTVLKWLYRRDGRIATETYTNNSHCDYTYNDAARKVTRTLKDSAGNILETDTQATDSRGNVIQKVDGEGYTAIIAYDGLNRVKTMSGPPAWNNSAQQQSSYTYDAAGITSIVTNAVGESTTTTCDALGRQTVVQVTDSLGQVVHSNGFSYSADQQSVTTVDGTATGITTTYTDLAGKPVLTVKADGGKIVSTYDAAENLLSTTNEKGRKTTYQYDPLNRLFQQTLPDGALTQYSYDAAGNILARYMTSAVSGSAGLLTWSATYDNASRKRTEQIADSNGAATRSFTYDYYTANGSGQSLGKRSTVVDGQNITTTFHYDAFGRVSQAAAVDPGANQTGVTLNYAYDRRGLVKQVDQIYQNNALSPPTSVVRTYDGYGAINTEQVYLNGSLKDTWQATHDAAGRRTTLTELNNPTLPFSYVYRADGRLTSTSFHGLTYQYTYGTDGLLTLRSSQLASGATRTQTISGRDPMGRITAETQAINGTAILTETLGAWNPDSTQNSYSATRAGSTLSSDSRNYSYDSRSRVAVENFTPATGGASLSQLSYGFDYGAAGSGSPAYPGLGLRTSVNLTGGGVSGSNSETETYGLYPPSYTQSVNELGNFATSGLLTGPSGGNQSISQTFDGMGQVAQRLPSAGSDTLTWDAFGRLVALQRRDGSNNGFNWFAVYDSLGRRLQTTQQPIAGGSNSGSPLTLQSSFDPSVEFLELAVTVVGGTRDWLVHGPDLTGLYGAQQGTGGLEAVYNATSGVTTSVVCDLYGHTVATLVGSSNTVTWNASRAGGYGVLPGSAASQPVSTSNDLTAALAWRGRYIDATGYYNLGARYYDPSSGTFLSPDPLGFASDMSLYAFCSGDPINLFDPTGRCSGSLNGSTSYQSDNTNLGFGIGGFYEKTQPSLFDAPSYGADDHLTKMIGWQMADPDGFEDMQYRAWAEGMTENEKLAIDIGRMVPVVNLVISGNEFVNGHSLTTGERISRIDAAFDVGLAAFDSAPIFKAAIAPKSIGTLAGRAPWMINCFPAGTLVSMADGTTKPIERIEEGELVKTTDPTQGGDWKAEPVLKLHKDIALVLVKGLFERADGVQIEILATSQHPFWTKNDGWKSMGALQAGDELVASDGSAIWFRNRQWVPGVTNTYNLTVQNSHTFYVGRDGVDVLVHNVNNWDMGTMSSPPATDFDRHEIGVNKWFETHNWWTRGSTFQQQNPMVYVDAQMHRSDIQRLARAVNAWSKADMAAQPFEEILLKHAAIIQALGAPDEVVEAMIEDSYAHYETVKAAIGADMVRISP